MTDKIKVLLEQLQNKEYRKLRRETKMPDYGYFGEVGSFADNYKMFADGEVPLLYEGDNFGFNISGTARLEFIGGNITPNYNRIISNGFDMVKNEIEQKMSETSDAEKVTFGASMLKCIDVLLEVCERYRDYAKNVGNTKLYNALLKVPYRAAETFYEACVFMKICTYFLRTAFVNHVGLGRFDQYMYSYYANDKARGVSDEEIFETLEEFFIALNRDADLYGGVQQGDNGQSMVLGGFDKDGNSVYNELSELCMKASLELKVIDPKINLRVGKNTPDSIYEYATLLTKQGLGFPQYCNDDVVVPGLIKLGYAPEDAIDYVVAACWEYIIPGRGIDVPNVAVMDFPNVVNRAICANIEKCDTFDELMSYVETEIKSECERIIEGLKNKEWWKTPSLSIFIDGCIETLTDMKFGGAKYFNFGCHGAGIANAADALAAIKMNVFDKKCLKKTELLSALDTNFENADEIRKVLLSSPKMGNNDDFVDDIACRIMSVFSSTLNNRDNGNGGIWRAGTGSAHEYMIKGKRCPATADGRKAYEPYPSSFSPALDVRTAGLLSVIQSFTKYDLTEIINGGPLTIEVHDTVLRNDEGIKKVAMLVKSFVMLGGHQLQINSVNRDRLLDAQKHPEKYPNLIVRVWGWSGYFNELDLEFQNHIIRRAEYMG